MKHCAFALLLMSLCFGTSAQGVFSNKTNTALQKVIEDYPNRFRNIIGPKLTADQRVTDYQSRIEVPGAMTNTVSHYSNPKTGGYSWKAELFESPNFEQSSQRFKEVFDNIKNTIVKIEGMSPVILNGKYEYPAEDKKATSISFHLLPANGELQNLRVELTMRQAPEGWKIILAVFEKELVDELAVY